MQQTTALINTLKRCLKEHGITYADLTQPLNLSEASVKRLMNMSELFAKLEQDMDYLIQLTEAQEETLASDEKHLLVMNLIFSDWTYQDILRVFTLSEPELIRSLVQLDKIGLIELLPKNRFKLLTAHNFTWRKDGPVQSFVRKNLQNEYFDSDFAEEGSDLTLLVGMLSPEARLKIDKKLQDFAKEFDQLCKSDSKTPLTERLGYAVVMAIRPWKLAFYSRYVKEDAL